mmetsp:Transcript_43446/g.85312  ORF Transcript_43446/g.85312 Transcript_43446/m.85312 type:complete len:209 (-) Transcript_43446:262-888(-)
MTHRLQFEFVRCNYVSLRSFLLHLFRLARKFHPDQADIKFFLLNIHRHFVEEKQIYPLEIQLFLVSLQNHSYFAHACEFHPLNQFFFLPNAHFHTHFSRAHQFALSKFHSFFPNISCRFLYFHYFLECLSLACRGFVLETNTCVITWYRSLRSLGSLIVFCLRARGTKSGFLECLVVLQRLGDSSEFLLSSLEESQLRVQISMVTRRV